MSRLLETPIGRLRAIGLVEGASFLVLLGIAMPLKYLAGLPIAVKVVGWTHGVLFVLFCVALGQATLAVRWSAGRTFVLFLASLVPFGTFLADKRLRLDDETFRLGAAARKAP